MIMLMIAKVEYQDPQNALNNHDHDDNDDVNQEIKLDGEATMTLLQTPSG